MWTKSLCFAKWVIILLVLGGMLPLWAAGLVLQKIDSTDVRQTLSNFDRGFYNHRGLHLKPFGNTAVANPPKLLHLRADISEFSSRAWINIDSTGGKRDTTWGFSQDLTEDALNALQSTFDNVRNHGGFVIVRICYDPWFNGRRNVTPEHKWVLRHVEQLAPVLSKNTDVILALEMGMHGAYGEMHSDTSITYPRVAEAVNLMLRNTPSELKILTRTANYSAAVLGFENWGVDFYIEGDAFQRIAKAKGDTLYRVGMFNDGYLGTEYDYGTWGADCATSICREEGVAWLEKYSVHTPYGGEALTTASGYKVINTPEYLSYEGYRTHTSYLNIAWNHELIDSWKNVKFQGKDLEYDSSVTGFKYIDDHLGYRYVLRESTLLDTIGDDGIFLAKLRIQNVGFGNLTRQVAAKVVFVQNMDSSMLDVCPFEFDYELPNLDFRNVFSRKISISGGDTLTTFDGNHELDISVPTSLENGNYHVFLNVENIAFANGKVSAYHCFEEPVLFIGDVTVDNNVKSSIARPIARSKLHSSIQNNFVRIQEVKKHWNAVVHNGNLLYRMNGSSF